MKTPSLDRLAQEGIRFEKAYTTQPVCQPARSAIFTGSAGFQILTDAYGNLPQAEYGNGFHHPDGHA